MSIRLGEARKFVTALSGAAAEAISLGLLSGQAEHWVTGGLAVLTAFLVYLVPNDVPAALATPAVPPPVDGPALPPTLPPQPGAPFSGGH